MEGDVKPAGQVAFSGSVFQRASIINSEDITDIKDSSSTSCKGDSQNKEAVIPSQETISNQNSIVKPNHSSDELPVEVKAAPEAGVRCVEATRDTYILASQPQHEGSPGCMAESLSTAARKSGAQECEARSGYTGVHGGPTVKIQEHIHQALMQSGTSLSITSEEGAVENLVAYQQSEQQTNDQGQHPHSKSQDNNEQQTEGMQYTEERSSYVDAQRDHDNQKSDALVQEISRTNEYSGLAHGPSLVGSRYSVHNQTESTDRDNSSSMDEHCELSKHQLDDSNSNNMCTQSPAEQSQTQNQCEYSLQTQQSRQQHLILESDQQQPSVQQDPSQQSSYSQDLVQQKDQSLHESYQQEAKQEISQLHPPQEAYVLDSSQHELYQQDPSEHAAVQQESSHHMANQQTSTHHALYQEDYSAHQSNSSSHTEHEAFQNPSQHTAHQDTSQYAAYQQTPSRQRAYQQHPSQHKVYLEGPSQHTGHPSQEAAYQQDPPQQAAYQQDPSQQAAYQQDPSQQAAYQQDPSQQAAYQQDPPQQAAYQQDPSQQAAYQQLQDPSQQAAYQQDPSQQAAYQQDPSQQAAYQQDPSQQAAYQQDPSQQAAYQQDPSQQAAYQQDPSQQAAYQQDPSQQAAYQQDPSQQAAYQQDPSQQAAYQQDPSQQAAYQQDPSQQAAYLQEPSQQAAYQQDPSQQAAYQQDPSQQAVYQQDPSQQAGYQDPSQQAAYQQDPSQEAAYQQDPSQQAAYQQDPSQQAAYQQDPSQQAAYQQDPSQQAAYQQDPSQQAAYQQDPSQQAAYQQNPSQQAAYQQDPSQQATYLQEPLQQAAYQQDPSQQAAYQQDPSQQAVYQQDPSQQAVYQQDPSQQAGYQDPSQQAAYQQDPSQEAAYQQDPSQQAAYQQDPSQEAAYQQDPSQQAAYQQDPSQQAAYQQDPSQQAAYLQDPSQPAAYQQDPSQQAVYQQDSSQQAAYQQDPSQQAAYQQDPSQQAAYQQDPSQQAAYQQDPSQQAAYQQDPSQQAVYQQDPSQQAAYRHSQQASQHEAYQQNPSQYQQDLSQQGTYQQEYSQVTPSQPRQHEQDPSQHASNHSRQPFQKDLPHHVTYRQGVMSQHGVHQQDPSKQLYCEQDESLQGYHHTQHDPMQHSLQRNPVQFGYQVPEPSQPEGYQQHTQPVTSQDLHQHSPKQSYQQNRSYSHTDTEEFHRLQRGDHQRYHSSSPSQEYSNRPYHQRSTQYDDRYSDAPGYHFQYYKTNDPRPPPWKNDMYDSQTSNIHPQQRTDSSYVQDSNSQYDTNQKIPPLREYGAPHGPPHESGRYYRYRGGWKRRWHRQEKLRDRVSDRPRTGYNTPPSHSWPSPSSTSSGSSVGNYSPGNSSPLQRQSYGSPSCDHESSPSQLSENQFTEDCHSPKKTSESKEEPEKKHSNPSIFSNQLRDPRQGNSLPSQAGSKHYTKSPKYDGINQTTSRRSAMLKQSNWKHNVTPKTRGPQLIEPHFKVTEKKSDQVHPEASSAAATKKPLSNFKIPKHKTSSEVSPKEISGSSNSSKKSKTEGEKCKPGITFEEKAVDKVVTSQAPKKSSSENVEKVKVSETAKQAVQKHVQKSTTKATGSGEEPKQQKSTVLHKKEEKKLPAAGNPSRDIAAILSSLDTSSLQALAISIQQTLATKAIPAKLFLDTTGDTSTSSRGSVVVSETTQRGNGADPTLSNRESTVQSETPLEKPQSHLQTNVQKSSGVVLATVLHSETANTLTLPTTSKNNSISKVSTCSSERTSSQISSKEPDHDSTAAQQSTALCSMHDDTASVDSNFPHPCIQRNAMGGESVVKQNSVAIASDPATPPVFKSETQSDLCSERKDQKPSMSQSTPTKPGEVKDPGESVSMQSLAGEYTKPTTSEIDLFDFYDPRYTYKEYNLRRRPPPVDVQPASKKRKITDSTLELPEPQVTKQPSSESPTQVSKQERVLAEAEQSPETSEIKRLKLNDSLSTYDPESPTLRESKPETNNEPIHVASKAPVQALPPFQNEKSHPFQSLEVDKPNGSLMLSEKDGNQTASEIRSDKARPKIISKRRSQVKKCRKQQLQDGEHNSDEGMLCALCNQKADYFNLGFVFGPYRYNQDFVTKSCENNDQIKAECSDLERHRTTHCTDTQVTCENISSNIELQNSSNVELWVHEECAVWAPGVCLVGNQLHGLLETVTDGAKMVCSSCGTRGATLGCGSRGCKIVYHYPCARQTGSTFLEEQFLIFCPKHKEVK